MHIKVINYAPSASKVVMAFVDVEVDHWLRFNGLNLLRDGSLRSSQLKYDRNGQRSYLSAVVIIDDDLRQLMMEDILAAIDVHVQALPPERRMRPPKPAPPKKPVLTESAELPESSRPAAKAALPPPSRLLAGAKGGRT